MSLRYQHHRLKSSRSFRVIRLHPSSEGKPLRCDILEASLDHPPVYEALSYTWGAAEPPRNLHCDGRLLPITTNCAGALERLRDRRKAGLFWIDSICIDQLSVQERNHQVVLMTEIYGSASRVMVDLGDGTQDSDAVIDFLSRLAPDSKIKKMINVLSGKGPKEAKVSMEIQHANHVRFGPQAGVHTAFKRTIMDDIFDRPWFERVWTIQELVMAKRAFIICGSRRISWDQFAHAIHQLFHSDPSNSLGLTRRLKVFDLQLFLRQTLDLMDRPRTSLMITRWCLNMASVCQRKSSEPRDKVFALYGIFDALGIQAPDPDYTKPLAQVFKETARSIIEAQDSLDMLYLASSSLSSLANLPSWTPDWTLDEFRVPMIVSNRVIRHYKAAADSRAVFQFSEDSSTCFVRGRVLDEVTVCGGVPPKDPPGLNGSLWSRYHIVLTLKRWIRLAMSQTTQIEPSWLLYDILSELGLPGSSINDEDLYDVWLSVLLDNATCCTHINSARERARFSSAIRNRWVPRPGLDEDLFEYFTTTPEFKALFHISEHPGLADFHLQAGAYAILCQFLITSKGNFARGPLPVRVGDIMVLIAGVELPMFLRSSDDGFVLIGPGYMHGVMYGEEWSADEGMLRQFLLV